jgi:hypothetical protein
MTPQWRKSSWTGGADDSACVEVARLSGVSWIRDAKVSGVGHRAATHTEPAAPTQSEGGDVDR